MRLVSLAIVAAAASAYYVHKDSAEHKREAAWTRTMCGSCE